MAVRKAVPHIIDKWRGLNSFIPRGSADELTWIDSDNVLVNARGEAEVLRSPKEFGTSSGTGSAQSADEFKRAEGHLIFIDHETTSKYLSSAGGVSTLATTFGTAAAWLSLTINNTFQRLNPLGQFLQFTTSVAQADNGIARPTVAPVISYAPNGDTIAIDTSLQMSYAYMNSVTGHVSQPSILSNVLGPQVAGQGVNITYSASPIVDNDLIVFFLTLDGGSVPFLILDNYSDPGEVVTRPNATSNFTFVLSQISRDTLTPEPIYNGEFPQSLMLTATDMFAWKDRIFIVTGGTLQYSGFESCYIGNPWESWPPLNQLILSNRSDRAIGGISTQSGALIFGEQDCYLLTGYPSDKVVSPQNVIAITEHLDPMNWNVGITYPRTAVNTQFGVIWVDQTRRIRLWNQRGFPSEIGEPLRAELDAMTGPTSARWFQHGKNGGYYILTDQTTVLFIMLYDEGDGQTKIGFGKSTAIAPEAMVTATFDNVEHFYFVKDNTIFEMLAPDIEGDGWEAGTEIYFKIVFGNTPRRLNFSSIHSVQVDGDLEDLEITHDGIAETDPQTVVLTDDLESDTGENFFGLVDSDERRYHVVKFSWGLDDSAYRSVTGFTANIRESGRFI